MIALSLLAPLPFLSPVFGSHMVLQRDKPNTFWGWSQPGDKVRVSIGSSNSVGVAAADGKWMVKLRPPKVGGPYEVRVEGAQKVTLTDVLVGDVWICSGQSNMEMGIGMARDAKIEIANANDPALRLFMGEKKAALRPVEVNAGTWATCTSQTVATGGWGGFSAVAYYFGRHLRKTLGVPIGLVQTAWGGTAAEAWTSGAGLLPVKDFEGKVAQAQMQATGALSATNELIEKWVSANSPFPRETPATRKVILPGRTRQMGFDGVPRTYWFKKTINIDKMRTGGWLTTGSNEGADAMYINGKFVMGGNSILIWHAGVLADGILREGENEILVRLIDMNGNGGFTNDQLNIQYPDGTLVPLSGEYEAWAGRPLKGLAPLPPMIEGDPNWPTVLHNGMLAPFQPLAIKGAIWYQGETNVGRAEQYSRLLPAMITDWRQGFGQGDFPFLVAQLANWGTKHPDPVDNGWSELQESQAIAVTRVKNAGLACTVDIGQGNDIHPVNKQDVGLRLALQALKIGYGQKLVASGPTFKSAKLRGNKLTVQFRNAEGGLMAKRTLAKCFAVLGASGKWAWADARIDGSTIVLSAAGVNAPKHVRYAWDEDPNAPLYNREGLPMVPFRTDSRK